MPEATVLIKNVSERKTKAGADWWLADDGVRSFSVNLTPYEGQQVQAEYEEREFNGRSQKNITKVTAAKEAPALGTGDYVKGKTAQADQIAANARKALEEAVKSLSHTVRADSDLAEYASKVSLLHSKFYRILGGFFHTKNDDENIPF